MIVISWIGEERLFRAHLVQPGARAARPSLVLAYFDQNLESSVGHALDVERHGLPITHRLDARIRYHFGIETVTMRPRLRDDP